MPNASATDPASFRPAPGRRSDPRSPAARSKFADALTFAYDIAYRAPGSLSLALRAAYGLQSANVVGRAELGNARPHPQPNVSDGARRAQLGDARPHARPNVPDVVGRAQLGDASRPQHPYFRFNGRADGLDIGFVVVRGRTFAGVRSWIR